ncbi:MAG TPA: hypothetical protein VEI94_05070 [Candidatus Bathyarchaeia archaeon]|nr:hypothetical protein [Candidatus Bathyarchaeia archaeon]
MSARPRRWLALAGLGCWLAILGSVFPAQAHPLGNFTVNHYSRIEVGVDRVHVRQVVDLAEIPTLQEMRTLDADGDGTVSDTERGAYRDRVAPAVLRAVVLTIDGQSVPLDLLASDVRLLPGAGNLPTLRLEIDAAGVVAPGASAVRRVRFADSGDPERLGWREIVVVPGPGIAVFDSSAFGNGLTDELKAYPTEYLTAPLAERQAEWSFAAGAPPAGSRPLVQRGGQPIVAARDRLAELITLPEMTPLVVLLALLMAAAFGAAHALSPGHGKTVVGAYLVGSRGTARHALFLGLTVTVTHTAGVFALGLVTLFASEYILPERLFPILSLISGGIVLVLGLTLFVRRLCAALGYLTPEHDHVHGDLGEDPGHLHSHDGGQPHSHLPPGGDGSPITWRSLLALGISGGLLPCPSALVVLLSAIALHRIGFGLLLIVAFSVGLAATLTAIGLAFVYASRWIKLPGRAGSLVQVLPVLSALAIACIGGAIVAQSLGQSGVELGQLVATATSPIGQISSWSILALGLLFGLRHAFEADHLAAVSTIVSQRRSILSASLVGGLWGLGHTLALVPAGIAVILLHVQIGDRVSLFLDFGVGLMLIGLAADTMYRLARGGLRVHSHSHGTHVHVHAHPHAHSHAHPHASREEMNDSSPPDGRIGLRPLLVGMLHGLAGSAALSLLVLSTIPSPRIGLAYIAVFGIGSTGGMMLMSALFGLPLHFTAGRFDRAHIALRGLAGLFSLAIGLSMVYEIGFSGSGIFR